MLNICLKFIHTLFPQNCLLCAAPAGTDLLCPPCQTELPLHSPLACPICAYPTLAGEICGACIAHRPAYNRSLAAYTYRYPLDKLIQALKYHHQFAVIPTLAQPLLAQIVASNEALPDAIVALPLHRNRLQERGFNQSHHIAQLIARQLQLPLLQHACQRTRDTLPQAALPIKARQTNIRNAFTCDNSVSGKRIAIVDDVMTSGSTLDSLARTLLQAGAIDVQCWVVARAVMK